ncbi:unnamed protein product [Closterium sp. NIES-64]|nr:unnamed protein product [Closterium sp. NIES-64]
MSCYSIMTSADLQQPTMVMESLQKVHISSPDNVLMESLQKFTSAPDMNELHRVAASFEQKIFSTATNQDDYLWRISQKMLYIKSKGHMLQAQAGAGTSSQASAGSVATGGMTADASNMSYPPQQQQPGQPGQPSQPGQLGQPQQAMRPGGPMMGQQQQQPGAMAPSSSLTGPGGMGAPVQAGTGMGGPGGLQGIKASYLKGMKEIHSATEAHQKLRGIKGSLNMLLCLQGIKASYLKDMKEIHSFLVMKSQQIKSDPDATILSEQTPPLQQQQQQQQLPQYKPGSPPPLVAGAAGTAGAAGAAGAAGTAGAGAKAEGVAEEPSSLSASTAPYQAASAVIAPSSGLYEPDTSKTSAAAGQAGEGETGEGGAEGAIEVKAEAGEGGETAVEEREEEEPMARLCRVMDASLANDRRDLLLAAAHMQAVLACSDRLATSAPLAGSRGALGEDLSATASSRLLADWMALNSLTFPATSSSWAHEPRDLPVISAGADAALAAAAPAAAAAGAASAGGADAAAGSVGWSSRRVVSVTASVVDHEGTLTSSAVHAGAGGDARQALSAGGGYGEGEELSGGDMGDGEVKEERNWGSYEEDEEEDEEEEDEEEEEWEEEWEEEEGGGRVGDGPWLVSRSQAAAALFPPRKRVRRELNAALTWEAQRLNEEMIDSSVEVSARETRRAHALGKDGTAVLLRFDIPSVAIPFPPLRLLVPGSYPHCSPQPWPFQAHPHTRSPVVQDAMDRFTIAMRAAKGPLTLTAMARAWDEHARAAVMHVLAASAPPNACWHAVVGPWHECAADVAHG